MVSSWPVSSGPEAISIKDTIRVANRARGTPLWGAGVGIKLTVMRVVVQRTGFEPAKHYALGPHPSPFDHSGTSAWSNSEPPGVYQNGEAAEINPHSY